MLNKKRISPIIKPSVNRLNVIIPIDKVPQKYKRYGTYALNIVEKGMTLLEYQIRNIPTYRKYTYIDVFVITGFQHEKIRAMFRGKTRAHLIYNPMYQTSNTCYSISLALEAAYHGDILIICNGAFFKKSAIATITDKNISKLAIFSKRENNTHKVGVAIDNGCITNISYSLPNKWANIIFITQPNTIWFEKVVFNHIMSQYWFLHETILHNIQKNNCKYYAHMIDSSIVTIEDFHREDFSTKIIT